MKTRVEVRLTEQELEMLDRLQYEWGFATRSEALKGILQGVIKIPGRKKRTIAS